MIAGKHYVSYEAHQETGLMLGVMRPGEAMQSASSSVPWNQSSSYILLDLNEVFNITILSAAVCTAHLAGIATHTIGEYVTLIDKGMAWNGKSFWFF